MNPIPLVYESRLVDLISGRSPIQRGWVARAACSGAPFTGDVYFPEDEQPPPGDALACCMSCPVAEECLATALMHEVQDGYRFGWWGGLGPEDRESVAQRLGLPVATDDDVLCELAELARRLRAMNHTVPSIAAELGCTERTVYRYLAIAAA